jgi:methylenetetrahydrofolate dehydrogenase (NADP+)/methenyltetrahydrofolate cyclohydrolase
MITVGRARLIDGRALAAQVRRDVRRRVEALNRRAAAELSGQPERRGAAHAGMPSHVRLDAILVGGDDAASLYAQRQEATCREVGIQHVLHRLPAEAGFDDIAGRVLLLNADDDVSAIMLHLPLPPGIDTERVQALIGVEKDIEGVNPANIGNVVYGRRSLVPCTALAVIEMIESTGIRLPGKLCVCVGASNIVGKPIAILLMKAEATVTSTNKYTDDLAGFTRQADVLIAAAGVPRLIRAPMVKPGAVVIDVGINRVTGADGSTQTVGDVAFDEVCEVAAWISPVPGGVGPMTVAMLLRNTVQAAEH